MLILKIRTVAFTVVWITASSCLEWCNVSLVVWMGKDAEAAGVWLVPGWVSWKFNRLLSDELPWKVCLCACWWLSARLQYFQCFSTGDTAVLHKAIDMSCDHCRCCGILNSVAFAKSQPDGEVQGDITPLLLPWRYVSTTPIHQTCFLICFLYFILMV